MEREFRVYDEVLLRGSWENEGLTEHATWYARISDKNDLGFTCIVNFRRDGDGSRISEAFKARTKTSTAGCQTFVVGVRPDEMQHWSPRR